MAKWQNGEANLTKCYRLYEKALMDQLTMGLRDKIPLCVDFYEGRQWPAATENTRNLPRPVVNIIKMICRSKKGAILSTPVKILYRSYSQKTDLERFNSFAKSVMKEYGQEELDRIGIDDAIKKGSCFFHYYWDSDTFSQESGETGALSCEVIDPLNIFFANPAEVNEQKQEWIMISSKISKEAIISQADKQISASLLELEETGAKGEITLLTRYFKKDGEIWCEKQTKYLTVKEPFKIIPDRSVKTSEENQAKNAEFRHRVGKNSSERQLYPIVCGVYERKEGSIYGMGEVEGLIPNQKAINFNIAMSLLNAQQCAWGKYVALPNALNGQKISNVPGQVLIDFSGTGEGIKKLPESELSRAPIDITVTLEELTRQTAGAADIITGEAYGTNLSGAAIAQLQAQAMVPIEELKNNFWSVKRKQGLVIAQFLKHFYFKRPFIKEETTKESALSEVFDVFSSKDYEDSIFDVYVEAVGGTKASLASDISLLDSCLKNGKISLETYIRAYPESAITNKHEILKQIELEKGSELEKLKKELKKYRSKSEVSP